MAKIVPQIFDIPGGSAVGVRVRWDGLGTGDVGAAMSKPEYQFKTVQVTGALVDGDLQGTNTPDVEDSWMPLLDARDGANLTQRGLYRIELNPLFIRPIVRNGDAVTFDIVYTQ